MLKEKDNFIGSDSADGFGFLRFESFRPYCLFSRTKYTVSHFVIQSLLLFIHDANARGVDRCQFEIKNYLFALTEDITSLVSSLDYFNSCFLNTAQGFSFSAG